MIKLFDTEIALGEILNREIQTYGEYEGIDESVQIRAYVFDDADFGQTRLEFVLFQGGFYTMSPDN